MSQPLTSIAIAVVEHQGHFLIGQRPAGAALGGLWEFPGGKIRRGESARDAAKRECMEETGLAIEVHEAYLETVYQYEHDRVRLHFFACTPAEPLSKPRAPFAWVTRDQLDHYEFPAGNQALLEMLRPR